MFVADTLVQPHVKYNNTICIRFNLSISVSLCAATSDIQHHYTTLHHSRALKYPVNLRFNRVTLVTLLKIINSFNGFEIGEHLTCRSIRLNICIPIVCVGITFKLKRDVMKYIVYYHCLHFYFFLCVCISNVFWTTS
jgi:hypothetical protein